MQEGGGEILSDAWDLQAELECASVDGTNCVGALLDYEKFFDLFHPDLAYHLFTAAGLPEDLASQLITIYADLKRYAKIAGTYGGVIQQTNGCPQGCSFSLIVANLYVATLFQYLESEHPQISLGAFIDDRNIRHQTIEELQVILEKICTFDREAGHKTNLAKSSIFANTRNLRDKLQELTVEDQKPKTILQDDMVGHTIIVHRSHRSTSGKANQRAEELIARARKISRAGIPYEHRRKLLETSAVPVTWCGSQWTLPKNDMRSKAANAVVDALWGNSREMRSKEIVLGILCDPTRIDPTSSMLYRRLLDARRMFLKDSSKLHMAIHVNESLGEDENPPTVGPVFGLRQAARALGGRLVTDQNGLTIEFSDGEAQISLSDAYTKLWKKRVRDRIRSTITAALDARTVPEGTQRDTGEHTRKDLHGVTSYIDDYATNSLTSRPPPKLPRAMADLHFPDDDKRYRKDNLWRQRVYSIIAGSLRAYDRLAKADLCENASCQLCGDADGTLAHVFWKCPIFQDERAPFIEALNKYKEIVANGSPWRAAALQTTIETPCVKNCGVIPDDPYLHSAMNQPKIENANFCQQLPEEAHNDRGNFRHFENHLNDRLKVYVDGSAFFPTDWRRTRAGWGVYVADGHPYNTKGFLPGLAQTSYRAELAAVAQAMTVIPDSLHIVSDCQSVVDHVQAVYNEDPCEETADLDLWKIIKNRVADHPPNHYHITWIRSHVTPAEALQIEEAGGHNRAEYAANDCADTLAKQGAMMHDIRWENYDAATDREIVATIIQRMQATVWASFFPLHEDDWAEGDNPTTTLTPPTSQSTSNKQHRDDQDTCQHDNALADIDSNVAPRLPLTIQAGMTTRHIAEILMHNGNQYCWNLNDDEYSHSIQLATPTSPYDYAPGAHCKISGRGRISTGIPHPAHMIEAMVWWFNRLRWTPHWQSRPQDRKPHLYTTSYMEMVIDYEAATGIDVPAQGWGKKAAVLAATLRTLSRIHTLRNNGTPATWGNAFQPKPSVPSLNSLGAPRVTGVSRRPQWVCNTTPSVIAANVWRCIDNQDQPPPPDNINSVVADRNLKRSFADEHSINRTGIPTAIQWKPDANEALAAVIKRTITNYYEQAARWQANPVGPPPVWPSVPQDRPRTTTQSSDPPRHHHTTGPSASSGSADIPTIFTSLRQLREAAGATCG